ncbi:PH domain-containing protein [Actinomadura parmotrematis]|uniref:PH domain-containing protein n=1 Tax=Actinomadura parmotrematis TaxID=2864039 RepID=A0ABS7FZT1_9ACTN|nr:PH domain-containing protein [Actinomadura parmotrematis]MBW8485650.1 PH domain-containing protein [Actinomadura parmotrematis]
MQERSAASRSWRVPPAHTVLKCAAAVAAAVLAVLVGDGRGTLLAGVVAAGFAVLAVRDLAAPVRVAADGEGVTVVAGYIGHRRLPWPEITAVRVDERRRLASRTRLLEIQTGDDLYLFSSYDLGADVYDVADALLALRGTAAG